MSGGIAAIGDGRQDLRDLRDEVDDLFWRYAEALDEGPLDAWPDLFTEDGSYRVVPRSNFDRGLRLATMRCDSRAMMRDRVYALQSANFYVARRLRHVVGVPRIEAIDGRPDAWTVRAAFSVFETLSLQPTAVLAVGEYRDVVVRDPAAAAADGADSVGALRFAERLVLNDSDLVPNSLVLPL